MSKKKSKYVAGIPIIANPVGSEYGLTTEKSSSDISELDFSNSGLRIVVITSPRGSLQHLWLEYYFPRVRGFRLLEEIDLMRYWETNQFSSDHHLFEITFGGWLDQESQLPGMIEHSIGARREWFIRTTNGSANVISGEQPLIRELHKR